MCRTSGAEGSRWVPSQRSRTGLTSVAPPALRGRSGIKATATCQNEQKTADPPNAEDESGRALSEHPMEIREDDRMLGRLLDWKLQPHYICSLEER